MRKFLGLARKRFEKGSEKAAKKVPSSHYYLRSLSWTSSTFYFLDSLDRLEVLRDFLGREGGSPGILPDPRDPPWGLSLCRGSPPRTSRRSRESGKEKVLEVQR